MSLALVFPRESKNLPTGRVIRVEMVDPRRDALFLVALVTAVSAGDCAMDWARDGPAWDWGWDWAWACDPGDPALPPCPCAGGWPAGEDWLGGRTDWHPATISKQANPRSTFR